MPNSYFRFREFTVWQDRCAMKVCTDASAFGAWLGDIAGEATKALDIGSGTGLLSLMVAQRSAATIDAVEVDAAASQQTAENFRRSPWPQRLHAIHQRFQDFAASTAERYDLIFSNPPFYGSDLKSANAQRNVALHGTLLTFEELISLSALLLRPQGRLALLVPAHRSAEVESLAADAGLHCVRRTELHQSESHPVFRRLYLFSNIPDTEHRTRVAIRTASGEYSAQFLDLMTPFYLIPYQETDEHRG